MYAFRAREYAKQCLQCAINNDFKQASYIRQQAYVLDPPGTIGIDWNDGDRIWRMDSNYLFFLNNEDFTDLQNSLEYIHLFKAGIFVDNLFGFRDYWGIKQIMILSNERLYSPVLEQFLADKKLCFDSISREFIYADTKMRNISAKQYYASCAKKYYKPKHRPVIYEFGEFNLGFLSKPTEKQLESIRINHRDIDLFNKMTLCNIEKFPKTFQTFQKHKIANSEKYKNWLHQYNLSLMRYNPQQFLHTKWGIYEKPNPYTIQVKYGYRNDVKKVF